MTARPTEMAVVKEFVMRRVLTLVMSETARGRFLAKVSVVIGLKAIQTERK